MQSREELNKHFGIRGGVRFEPGRGDMTRAVINTPNSEAHLYLHGAHLTHYQPKNQPPLLFVSKKSFFEPGKPIRGGVPVIFPWFGPQNDDRSKMHGFVRLREWQIESASQDSDGSISLVLTLKSIAAMRALWPHYFGLRLAARIGPALEMSLEVYNTSNVAFTFEEALHTYFHVSDIRNTSVTGLEGQTYRDRNISPDWQSDLAHEISFTRRTDRLYKATTASVTIVDRAQPRRIHIANENSQTTVVWNPWTSGPGEFLDLGPDDWEHFVCVETANARENSVTLAPGAKHTMGVRISARS